MPSVAVDRVASVAAEEEIVAAPSVLADKIGIRQRVVAIASEMRSLPPPPKRLPARSPKKVLDWFGWSKICASSPVVPTIVAMGVLSQKFVRHVAGAVAAIVAP